MNVLRNSFMLSLLFLLYACAPTVAPVPVAVAEEVPPGDCPQDRKTPTAPAVFLSKTNPLKATPANLKAAKALFEKDAKPIACMNCHGVHGNGSGDPDFESTPPARNFTCKATMKDLKDGQLFWIIQNGSPNTSMFSFKASLSDDDIWKLVLYVRQFGK